MKEINTGLFLDDFEAEARMHIEKIESAFLDVAALADSPTLINGIFRRKIFATNKIEATRPICNTKFHRAMLFIVKSII